jgi:hypothetical protein
MPIKIALVANPRITLNPESSSSRQACPEAIYLLRRLVEYLGIREDVDLLCIIGELLAPAEEPQPALTALKAILDKASFPVLMAPAHGTAGAELCLEIFGKEMFRDLNGFRVQACDFPPEKELSLDSLQAALDAAASPSPAARKRVVILPTGIRPTTHPGAFSPDVLSAHNIAAIVTARSPAMADEPNLAGIEALDDFSATPYSFALLSLADGDQAPTRQDITLRLPLPLRDLHTHSHFAYCNDDLDLAWESRLMDAVNLSGTAITEHSGHLVFSQKEYWGKHWYPGDPSASRRSITEPRRTATSSPGPPSKTNASSPDSKSTLTRPAASSQTKTCSKPRASASAPCISCPWPSPLRTRPARSRNSCA